MMGRLKFTIYHGFVASLALHSALGLPFVLHGLASPPEEPPTLVVELQGVVAESQTEQKVQQETKGEAAERANPAEAAMQRASDDPPPDAVTDETESAPPPAPANPTQNASPPAQATSGGAGSNDILGAEAPRSAQTIKKDRERLKDYGKLLGKKVQANLVYPEEGPRAGLHGAATVSFTILPDGQIRPETLKILASSGQPKLDESALKTIRSSAPFDPPPKEITVSIAVAFGRKR